MNPDSEDEPNQVYFVSSSCLLAFDPMALIWYFELTAEGIVSSECESVKTIGNPDRVGSRSAFPALFKFSGSRASPTVQF
jgi:hypothetical protein